MVFQVVEIINFDCLNKSWLLDYFSTAKMFDAFRAGSLGSFQKVRSHCLLRRCLTAICSIPCFKKLLVCTAWRLRLFLFGAGFLLLPSSS